MLVTVGTMSSGFCLKPSTCSTVTQDAAAHAGRDAPDDASAERDAEPDGELAIEPAQSSGSQSPTAELLVGIKHTGDDSVDGRNKVCTVVYPIINWVGLYPMKRSLLFRSGAIQIPILVKPNNAHPSQ